MHCSHGANLHGADSRISDLCNAHEQDWHPQNSLVTTDTDDEPCYRESKLHLLPQILGCLNNTLRCTCKETTHTL